jgi:uncharacterized membrane protein YhhN
MQKIVNFAFAVVFFVQLLGRYLESEILNYLSKPLIMPCLAILFYFVTRTKEAVLGKKLFDKLILAGFFFSWLGDIALMFDGLSPHFFLLGLANFLIAHICYIFAFYDSVKNSTTPSLLSRKPYFFLPLLMYGVGLFYFLFPNLQQFVIPVFVYALVITLMAIFALNRKNRVGEGSFKLVFYGSLLFVLSDSLIALNKFLLQIPMSGLWVMLTYMFAQYLIMKGSSRRS